MGQALYRKYRSKSLTDIIGQAPIVTTLQNALQKGAISHAYLFTGPRGVGKTSIARILAHAVNELPYNDDSLPIDVIEIDAASNRGIDEIRELRERVFVAPVQAKYKVYIIDEVHMLTKEAFNALLKTLEEPPAHVIFILATTEAHKLPETIISRTQHYSFRPIDDAQALIRLKDIARNENIKITNDALALIAAAGNGSLRDSVGVLDQVSNSPDKIEAKDIEQLTGSPPAQLVEEIIMSVREGSIALVVQRLHSAREQGLSPILLSKHILSRSRLILFAEQPDDSLLLSTLIKRLLYIPTSPSPFTSLEMALIDSILEHSAGKNVKKEIVKTPDDESTLQPKSNHHSQKAGQQAKSKSSSAQPKPSSDSTQEIWAQTLAAAKKQHNTLYSMLRMAKPQFADGTLTLIFRFPFHKKILDEVRNQQIVQQILDNTSSQTLSLRTKLAKANQSEQSTGSVSSDRIDTISNIFGGAEVLES